MTPPFVLLDIGATLIQGPALTPAKSLAHSLGLTVDQRRALDRLLLTRDTPAPAALAALLADQFGQLGVDGLVEQLWDEQRTAPQAVEGSAALLARLDAAGIPYGFASNIWRPYFSGFLRVHGAAQAQRPKILSFEARIAKPDPAFYAQALTLAGGRPPSQVVMIGDSYDNDMSPALAAGLRTIWLLRRPDKEAGDLAAVRAGRAAAPHRIVAHLDDVTLESLACA